MTNTIYIRPVYIDESSVEGSEDGDHVDQVSNNPSSTERLRQWRFDEDVDEKCSCGPFGITTAKKETTKRMMTNTIFVRPESEDGDIVDQVSIDRLRRWREAARVLNASRRFRYRLDLKKEEEKEQVIRKIRAHAQVIQNAILFREAGEQANVVVPSKPAIPSADS